MNQNRLPRLLQPEPVPAANPGAILPAGFAVCPMGLVQSVWQQQLYQAAFERAQATLAPPRHHRLNLECWN
jgi:hypothetical protein